MANGKEHFISVLESIQKDCLKEENYEYAQELQEEINVLKALNFEINLKNYEISEIIAKYNRLERIGIYYGYLEKLDNPIDDLRGTMFYLDLKDISQVKVKDNKLLIDSFNINFRKINELNTWNPVARDKETMEEVCENYPNPELKFKYMVDQRNNIRKRNKSGLK